MKRKFITIPIVLLLSVSIIVTTVLLRIKPDTSNITVAQRVATFSKPAVVRIFNYAIVKWRFNNYYDQDLTYYFNSIQNETLIGGSGSGAIISSNGYIVTNAHVVELSKLDDEDIVGRAFTDLCTQVASEFGVTVDEARKYLLKYVTYDSVNRYLKVIIPNGEVFDGEIKSYGAPVGEGKDVSVVKIESKNLPSLRLGASDKVKLQDSIWVFGYPGAADSEILSPSSAIVVSITDGKVSATDKKSTQGASVLQISAAASHGNSGGPVVNEQGEIVGLLTFRGNTVNGQEVQGFNFAVPVDTAKEFVSQAGANNDPSIIDNLYKEGMELYWGGYYKDAITKFEEIQRLYPEHSEIKELITDSQQNMSNSKTLWSKYKTMFIIYDSIAGVFIVLLIIYGFVLKPKKETINIEEDI